MGVTASGAANSLVTAVGVLAPLLSADLVLPVLSEGSSLSFSALEIRVFRLEEGPSFWKCAGFLPGLEGPESADNGTEEFAGAGWLIEAWAVLDDRDEVGGPEKIDLLGVPNGAASCEGGKFSAASSSGAEFAPLCAAGRGEKMLPDVDDSISVGEGVFLGDVAEGNPQVGFWACES